MYCHIVSDFSRFCTTAEGDVRSKDAMARQRDVFPLPYFEETIFDQTFFELWRMGRKYVSSSFSRTLRSEEEQNPFIQRA